MVQVINLTKRYGQHIAVDNVSFTVDKGEILGFLGPNGAGKTTTMNIITGYLSATEGSVKVDGFDILEEPEEVKKRIGYMPEFPPLYMDMTVQEYLNFVSDIKKIDRKTRARNLDRIMDMIKIGDVRKRLIKNLSKGYKQRVGLAQALIGAPQVLILDEPTVGLDPKQIIEIRNLIKELGKEHTIILSSHILPEVSAVCERVLIINKGKIVASDTPENLSRRLGDTGRLSIRVAGPEKQVLKLIGGLAGVKSVESTGAREPGTVDILVEVEKDIDVRRPVFYALSRAEYPILHMKPIDLTPEEISAGNNSREGGFLNASGIEKELRAYFYRRPDIFLWGFSCCFRVFFTYSNLFQANPSYLGVLGSITFIFLIVVPILTMRLMSEESRQKTDQLLLTSPLSVTGIVWVNTLPLWEYF